MSVVVMIKKEFVTLSFFDSMMLMLMLMCNLCVVQVRRLNTHYQQTFHREKARLQERPEGNQFDFSEMSIFGKFDSFVRRIDKV